MRAERRCVRRDVRGADAGSIASGSGPRSPAAGRARQLAWSRCLGGGSRPMVSRGWRDAVGRPGAAVGTLPVVCRAGGDRHPARPRVRGPRDRASARSPAVDDLEGVAPECRNPCGGLATKASSTRLRSSRWLWRRSASPAAIRASCDGVPANDRAAVSQRTRAPGSGRPWLPEWTIGSSACAARDEMTAPLWPSNSAVVDVAATVGTARAHATPDCACSESVAQQTWRCRDRPHPGVRGPGAPRLLRLSRLLPPRYAFATVPIVAPTPRGRDRRRPPNCVLPTTGGR